MQQDMQHRSMTKTPSPLAADSNHTYLVMAENRLSQAKQRLATEQVVSQLPQGVRQGAIR